MAKITYAGESLIAQKLGTHQVLDIARFVFANVPGLDPQKLIDRAEVKPPANQIVHTYTIPADNRGYVNPNQVVYSSMLGSDIGDFDFNWVGLESAEGVLFAVAYLPLQQKRRNIPPAQLGNNITRNILVEFTGAQELTKITISASTWQHDFTVRLAGIDERERLSNRDMFGRSCFFADGLQVEKVGAAYQVKAGLAYVEGVRVHNAAPLAVPGSALPTTVWIDVVLERQLNDVVARWSLACAADRADYKDALGVQHYCIALADISSQTITDRRTVETINGPLVKHFASRQWVSDELEKKANKASTLAGYGITDAIKNVNPLPGGSYDLHGSDYAFVTAQIESHLCQNCYWDGTSWLRHDVTKPAVMLLATAGKLRVRRVAAGANPIVWTVGYDIRDSSDTYSALDIDRLLTTISDAIKLKADKATTLAGYGITDAIPNLNPLPNGSLDVHGGSYAFLTSNSETAICQNCYWNGTNWVRHNVSKPAVCIFSNNGETYVRKAEIGANPIQWSYTAKLMDSGNTYSSTKVDELLKAVNDTLTLYAQKFSSIDITLNGKAAKATTLAGYGITDALQNVNPLPGGNFDLHGASYAFVTAQVESHLCQNCYWNGTSWLRHDVTKPAIAVIAGAGKLRVQRVEPGANPIAFTGSSEVVDTSRVATAQAAGIAPIAAIEQLDAGTDDSSIVTPKKLRWGFSISLSPNGYIAFPRWLGGLVIQWGNAYLPANNTQFLFPIAFPNACFVLNIGSGENTTASPEVMNIVPGSKTKTGFAAYATEVSTYSYIAIGN